MNLSKAYDTLYHGLLIVKLNAYAFQHALKLTVTLQIDGIEQESVQLLVLGKSKYKGFSKVLFSVPFCLIFI